MRNNYKLLVVGDPHAHPDYDNHRFDWLGQFIMDEMPDEVLCMGDFRDLPSLCRHSSRMDIDGARVLADLQAASDAETRMFAPYQREVLRRKTLKKGRPAIKFTMLLGNHDVRLDGVVNDDPRLEDLIHAPWHPCWNEIVPFKEVYRPGGLPIACSHYFVSGQMEKAMGGLNLARKLVLKNHVSTIVGHSHLLDYHQEPDAFGNTLFGLSVGHYGHLDYREGWCLQSRHQWWSGVVVLELGPSGELLEKREVSQERLRERYG